MGECLLVRRGGGTDTSDASAIENKVLAQETFYGADGEKKTGTMANNGVFTPAPLAAGGSIELGGYHAAGSRVTAATLASQTPASATAGHILVNQTAWVNGNKINGGIPATPVDANGYMPANEISGWAGHAFMGIQPYAYTNGHWVHSEQPDLQPANILNGKSIFNVVGTLKFDVFSIALNNDSPAAVDVDLLNYFSLPSIFSYTYITISAEFGGGTCTLSCQTNATQNARFSNVEYITLNNGRINVGFGSRAQLTILLYNNSETGRLLVNSDGGIEVTKPI